MEVMYFLVIIKYTVNMNSIPLIPKIANFHNLYNVNK